jgi:hypothetical protein
MEERINLSESASIKLILDDIKGVIGLKSITFLLDGQPQKPIPLGGAVVLTVLPGHHTIQTVLKARSFYTLFITITRRSTVLTISTSPNTQVEVMATYNRTWGNIEIKPMAKI